MNSTSVQGMVGQEGLHGGGAHGTKASKMGRVSEDRHNEEVSFRVAHVLSLEAPPLGKDPWPPSARVARLNPSFSLKSHWCCPNRNLLFLAWLLEELLPTCPRPQNSPSQI